MKISYREVKRRQLEDFRTYPMGNLYNIYRHFSTPFTYLSLRLGITPNQITISYLFCCIIGGILLAIGTYPAMLMGMLFFLIFKVLDDSDGEVARMQGSNSVEGLYLDRIGHYVYTFCLGMGLGTGLYKLYNNYIFLIIGISLTFILILEHAILDLLTSMLRKKMIESMIKNRKFSSDHVRKLEMTRMLNGNYTFSKLNVFSKLFNVYPNQGLLYGEHIYTLVVVFLIILDYVDHYFRLGLTFYGKVWPLLPLYLIVISISKIIWAFAFIYALLRKKYITNYIDSIEFKLSK